jgi:hypothetical protein
VRNWLENNYQPEALAEGAQSLARVVTIRDDFPGA